MDTIEEKRVYGDREGAAEVYVAGAAGVVRVRVAGDAVGEFGLVERAPARDVAAGSGLVAVATGEDVVVAAADDVDAGEPFEGTAFGPATAVGLDDGTVLAASPDGTVARRRAGEWTRLERADADGRNADADGRRSDAGESDSGDAIAVRAIDGDLVATDLGVYRAREGTIEPAGLESVRDVAAGGPLAATDDGLYELGNGWLRALEGSFDVCAADAAGGREGSAHAADGTALYERGEDGWIETEAASAPIAGIAHGETAYAVTDRGTLLARRDRTEWRSRSVGVDDVRAVAVARPDPGRSRQTDV